MFSGHVHLSVYCTDQQGETWRNGKAGCLLVVHYWADLQPVHGLQHSVNAKCQRVLVLALCLVFGRPFVKRFALCYRTVVLSVCPLCNVGVLRSNGWIDQHETWHAGRPRPWPQCVRWGPSSPSPKGAQPPNFRPISVAAKWLHGSRCHLVWR